MRFWITPTTVLLTLAAVTSAAAWSNGGPAPDKVLQGAATGLGNIQGIAVAASGTTFVVNYNSETLTAHDGDWADGNTAPSKTLVGAATGLNDPYDVAVDSLGRTYVANLNGDLTVYAANWAAGNTAPSRRITEYGTNTQLVDALALTVKDDGTIYVVQNKSNPTNFMARYIGEVLVYGPTATGDVAPVQVISGGASVGNTGLSYASGIAVDGDGLIYVATGSNGVKVFAANASGNATPVKSLTGNAYRVTLDTAGRLYVTDQYAGAVRVYEAGFASGASPIKTLSGGSTGFGEPRDVAFDATGRMYVGTSGNTSPTSVRVFSTSYQSITFPPLADTALSAGPVTASASASSMGTVTFSTTTPSVCTSGGTDGATITLVSAGTCTVRASQLGTAAWNPAQPVDRSFVVTATPPTSPSPGPTPTPSAGATPETQSPAAATAVTDTPARLTTTLLPSRTRLAAGQLMRLGIRAANAGGTATAPVTACVRLPANLVVVRGTPASRSGRTMCFSMGAVPAGAQTTQVVTVRAEADGPTTDRISGASRASGSAAVAATPVTVAIASRSGWTKVTG